MKKGFLLTFLLLQVHTLFAQNEIGPEGQKLLWVILFLAAVVVTIVITAKPFKKKSEKEKKPLFTKRKLNIELKKDALYLPDNLSLTVKNAGNTDVDLEQPLLVFDNFWIKRKFKLKGMGNHSFYPLYLEKGKSHTLQIDLTRFYGHDKKLKKFPKATIYLSDVKGKRLGKKSTYLRKTLLKF